MLDYLIHLIGRLGHWGYLVIGLGAMLESAAFLGVFVPGESLVLVAGFFAARGVFDLDALILMIAFSAAIGDSIGYELGRKMGRPALVHHGKRFGITEERVKKADDFFHRHGGKAVFLGRFIGFARALVPFLAGSSQMRYRVFLPYNALGAALWSAAITLLGYFLGASWGVAEKWIGRASAILGGIALLVFLGYLFWKWAVRHEVGIRRTWHRLLERPTLKIFRRRFAPQLAFLKARLSPNSYLGLRLTLSALLLLGAAWLFGGVTEDVIHRDPLTKVDAVIADWLHQHTVPWMTTIMLGITDLHGVTAMSVWVVLTIAILVRKRSWYWLLAFVLTVPAGMVFNVLVKHAVHRVRPHFDHPLVVLTTYSFPSGHTAQSTLFYGFLCAWFVATHRGWSARVWAVLVACGAVLLVAFTRLYLGLHYLSDVIGAMAEGVAWLSLCLTSLHTYTEHRRARERQENVGSQPIT